MQTKFVVLAAPTENRPATASPQFTWKINEMMTKRQVSANSSPRRQAITGAKPTHHPDPRLPGCSLLERPVAYAQEEGYTEIVELLRTHGTKE